MKALRYAFPLFLALTSLEADPTPVAPKKTLHEAVNSLDDSQVQKAIDAILGNFLSSNLIDESSRQRALLEGLASRLSPGVSLVAATPETKPAPPIPFLVEILDGQAGYIRPGIFDLATLTQIDAALKNFYEKGIPALILDLRAIPAGSEFELAADLARRFTPKGKILFTIQKPNAKQERILTSDKDPAFNGILIVLTDADTAGAAEALAATLRLNAKAMIVGAETSGAAVEYADFPVGSGRSLRVAVSRVSLPELGSIFPNGIKPDIQISLPKDVQTRIFEMSREKGVSDFVFDAERPRLNEAALVANTNPEISAGDKDDKPALRDTVLQRAMDLVTAIRFYKKSKP